MSEYELQVPLEAAKATAAISRAAEEWGAAWQSEAEGGKLVLPVVQGLKRGALKARISLTEEDGGVRLHLHEEESRLQLNRPAFVILIFGAAGGVVAMLWPFFENLLPLAPAGVVLALAAWLLVTSRLRSSGPQDFLDLVERMAGEERAPASLDENQA
jgi:hypothetical protein